MMTLLPIHAEELVPHRPPMRLVDRLLEVEDRSGIVEAMVHSDNPLAGPDGILEDLALVELLAQGYAALKGYLDRVEGNPVRQGFLVGIKTFEKQKTVAVGDRLLVKINTLMEIDDFAVADGKIWRDDVLIANGEIKVWIN